MNARIVILILSMLSSAAWPGSNPNISLSVVGGTQITGASPGDVIQFTIHAQGLTEVKNVGVTLHFPDPTAFDLSIVAGNVSRSAIWKETNPGIDWLSGLNPVGITDISSGNRILQWGGSSRANGTRPQRQCRPYDIFYYDVSE